MLKELITSLKSNLVYQAERKKLIEESENLTGQPLNMYLVYDIDDKKYLRVSEWKINYNQIVLVKIRLPAKKSTLETVVSEPVY